MDIQSLPGSRGRFWASDLLKLLNLFLGYTKYIPRESKVQKWRNRFGIRVPKVYAREMNGKMVPVSKFVERRGHKDPYTLLEKET